MKHSQTNRQTSSQGLTFREFIRAVNPKYKFYLHVEKLIAVLQRVADGEIKRLMVFMPPRHGKSETISRLFSAYYLYRHPAHWVGLNSYGDGLAVTLSRNARENYRLGGGVFNHQAEAAHHWETNKGGGMWASGVGGPITGKGFHLGIIDDPVKNAEEAQSETVREKHKDWWRSTFTTREEPNGAIVIVNTRWHEDDLSGWLLAQEKIEDEAPEHWHILSMEAIKADKPQSFSPTCIVEPDDRQPGEALCPERYDADRLAKAKRRVGSYFWAALYQQNPQPDEGNIFHRVWWRYWKPKDVTLPPVPVRIASDVIVEIVAVDLPDTFDKQVQSWDCAFKDESTSDYVAGQVWGLVGANKYMLDYRKEQIDIVGTMAAITQFTAKWPQTYAKLIEDKANGPAVIQMLRNKISGLIPVEPQGGKVVRARAVAPEVESGNVYLPHPLLHPWVEDFISNCASFPNAAHDDDVDSFTQAIINLGVPSGSNLVDFA